MSWSVLFVASQMDNGRFAPVWQHFGFKLNEEESKLTWTTRGDATNLKHHHRRRQLSVPPDCGWASLAREGRPVGSGTESLPAATESVALPAVEKQGNPQWFGRERGDKGLPYQPASWRAAALRSACRYFGQSRTIKLPTGVSGLRVLNSFGNT